jgi:hypothetical protein
MDSRACQRIELEVDSNIKKAQASIRQARW